MKKIILSFVGVCALFICICSLLITESYNLGSHKMATDTDYINTASISKDNAYDMSGDSAILIESTGIYSTQDTIILTFKTNTISKIVSYSIDSEGFKVLNHYKSGFEIFVKVKLYKEIEHPFVKVKINLQNGNSPEPVAYGYYKNGMVSINPYSYIDAMEEMNDYQLKNNLINKQEYEGASTELNSLPLQESVNSISRSEISLLSTNATVKGKVSWIGDDSKSHPLLFALVELYKIDSVTPLMSTYTDVAGNYSFSYSLSSGQEITPYVRIYPAGENVKVLKNDGSQYVWQSSSGTELTAGSSIEFNATFNMNSNLGRAFQISQPAIMASRFVKAMSGSNIATVSVCYPYSSDGCFYRRSTKTIYVTGNARASTNVPHSYASWDTIMHEYGHHVSYEFDIINSCGGTHWLGLDMANHYRSHLEGDNANTSCSCSYAAMNMNTAEDCKYWANRLAWSEGWASVFGTVVQQYYSSSLSNIATVGDTSYTSYNGVNYDLEKPSYINGESCELTVQAALWDMFDSVAETHDTLSLGYNSFWNMTTGSKAKSYEEFMNYFNENINNVSHISAAGKINTYYKMSPNNARLSSGTISTTAPVITWDNMSFGSKYYNTATYTVKFLDGV